MGRLNPIMKIFKTKDKFSEEGTILLQDFRIILIGLSAPLDSPGDLRLKNAAQLINDFVLCWLTFPGISLASLHCHVSNFNHFSLTSDSLETLNNTTLYPITLLY
jgi:hypothetical protein